MTLAQLTRESVLAALEEYDRIGSAVFLETYGFRRARSYLLVHNGRTYDSKAIAGAAHAHATGAPLRAADFSGGDATVGAALRSLGFTIKSTMSPAWDWQEVVLACGLVVDNGWRELRTGDSRVDELSDLLRRMPIHPLAERPHNFRSPDAVSRKTTDLATAHPDYSGKRTRGGKTDAVVIGQFLSDRERMTSIAVALREGMAAGDFAGVTEARVTDLDEPEAEEGGLLLRRHLSRERSPRLRAGKIAEARRNGSGINCDICGFDYAAMYGEHGGGYIECHHIVPLHATGRRTVRLADLILICANCHRMIHRRSPWLSPDDLRARLTASRPTPSGTPG